MTRFIYPIILGSFIIFGSSTTFAQDDAENVSHYYEDAQKRRHDGEPKAAIIQLKNALQINPQHLPSLILMGAVYLEQQHAEAAEYYLSEALTNGADLALVGTSLARAYLLLGQYKKILVRLDDKKLNSTNRADLLAYHAEAYLGLGRLEDAEKTIKKARSLSSKAALPRVTQITIFLRRGQAKNALESGEALVREHPQSAPAWNAYASAQHVHGQLEQALESYSRATSLDPTHVNARIAKIGLLLDLKRDKETVKDLTYLTTEYPNEPRSSYLNALKLAREGKTEQSRLALSKAVELFTQLPPEIISRDPQLSLTAALSSYGAKQWEHARKYLESYLQIKKSDIGARKLLGDVYLRLDVPNETIKLLDPYVRVDTKDVSLLTTLAAAYSKTGDHIRATRMLEQAASHDTKSTDLQTRLALSKLSSGNIERGLSALSKLYKLDNTRTDTGFSLAINYLKTGNYREALPIIEQLIKTEPDNLTYKNLLGITYFSLNAYDKAQKQFESILKSQADFLPARINLAKVELASGNTDTARSQLVSLKKKYPENAKVSLELSRVERSQNQLYKAIDLAKEAYRRNDKASTLMYLAELYVLNQEIDKAEKIIWEADSKDPENLNVMEMLARILMMQGENQNARMILKRMVRVANFDTYWLLNIAQGQEAINQLEDAQYTLFKATQSKNASLATHAAYAELLIKTKNHDQAQEIAERLIKEYPDSAEGHVLMGQIMMASQHYEKAGQYFQKALKLDPKTGILLLYYRSLLSLQANDKAEQALTHWLKQYPDDDDVTRSWAEYLLINNELERSQRLFSKLLGKYPDNPNLNNNMAYIMSKLEQSGAETFAQKAVTAKPDNAMFNDTLGWILVGQGKFSEGLAYIREASVRASTNPEIRYHLGYAFHQLGRHSEARMELETALKSGLPFSGKVDAEKLLQRLQ